MDMYTTNKIASHSRIAFLGYGDPQKQWGGTSAVTSDILQQMKDVGECPDYIFGVGSNNSFSIDDKGKFIAFQARRFFLNTSMSFFEEEDDQIIRAVVDVCRRRKISILHIQDYCGWPAGMIAAVTEADIKVIVKIGNAWSLCPRLVLFNIWNETCRNNTGLTGCPECVSVFPSPNQQRASGAIKQWIVKLVGVSFAYKLKEKFQRYAAMSNLLPGDYFRNRTNKYLNDLGCADLIHFSSNMSRIIYLEFGLRAKDTSVLPPSVKANLIQQAVRPVNKNLKQFGYVGGISELKGVNILIDAFRALDARGESHELKIWGSGKLSLLEGLPKNIKYMGKYDRSMLTDIMQAIDCGIVPSTCPDVHPVVAVEFTMANRPIIMSSSTGTATSPINRFPDLVFQSGNRDDLIRKIQGAILNWESIREKLCQGVCVKSISDVVDEYHQLYRKFS